MTTRTKNPADVRWHPAPAWMWLLVFVLLIGGDWMLGRWVLLPIFIAGFYGGMIVIDLFAYPMLERWRSWLEPRGPWAWYAVEIGVLWLGTTLILAALAPWWLGWTWPASGLTFLLQGVGALLLAVSVGVGVWGVGQLGWARVLFTAAMFPPERGAATHGIPQKLVLTGPYRYVRNPLYTTDMTLIFSTALLTRNWGILLLLLAYVAQLIMQIRLEERELTKRFGAPYQRYVKLVPRFVPRLTPVDTRDILGENVKRRA